MALRPLSKPLTFDRKSLQRVQDETTEAAGAPEQKAVPLEAVREQAAELTSEPHGVDIDPIRQLVFESKREYFQQQPPEFEPFLLSKDNIERYLEANPEVKGMFCDSKTTWSYGQRVTKYGPINWTLANKYIFWIDSSKRVHMDPRNWDEALPPAMPGGAR